MDQLPTIIIPPLGVLSKTKCLERPLKVSLTVKIVAPVPLTKKTKTKSVVVSANAMAFFSTRTGNLISPKICSIILKKEVLKSSIETELKFFIAKSKQLS